MNSKVIGQELKTSCSKLTQIGGVVVGTSVVVVGSWVVVGTWVVVVGTSVVVVGPRVVVVGTSVVVVGPGLLLWAPRSSLWAPGLLLLLDRLSCSNAMSVHSPRTLHSLRYIQMQPQHHKLQSGLPSFCIELQMFHSHSTVLGFSVAMYTTQSKRRL